VPHIPSSLKTFFFAYLCACCIFSHTNASSFSSTEGSSHSDEMFEDSCAKTAFHPPLDKVMGEMSNEEEDTIYGSFMKEADSSFEEAPLATLRYLVTEELDHFPDVQTDTVINTASKLHNRDGEYIDTTIGLYLADFLILYDTRDISLCAFLLNIQGQKRQRTLDSLQKTLQDYSDNEKVRNEINEVNAEILLLKTYLILTNSPEV
jgi:lipid II:glycine glycyltransferase (peptidoglycan interpeptide bridge formation enzyme)